MKKRILLLFFVFSGIFTMNAQLPFFVSGYVTNLNNAAIANHIVYIVSDTTIPNPIFATTTTNNNGYYAFTNITVPAPGLTTYFTVYTYDCNGIIHSSTVSNTIAQNIVNFSICNGTSSNCNAFFSHNTSSSSNYTLNFTDLSTGSPVSWYWNFGDGTSSTLQNPTHSYNSSGYKNICLTITTANCTSTYCDTLFIQGSTSNTCQAGFYSYPDSLALNSIHFLNTSNTTYLNYPITYTWNFGDGTTSTLQNPVHTFSPGASGSTVYNVCLTMNVIASNNTILCSNTICHTVTVGTPANNCQNSFNYTHQNLLYAFNGQINSSNPTTYNWNFGDGTTASGQYVTHTFALPPTGSNGYHVCLTTITSNSLLGTTCVDTTCQFITINNNANTCNANFVFHPDSLLGMNTIHFYNTSTTTYTNYQIAYLWNFGDGTTSTQQHPTHTFTSNPSSPSTYNVCLTIKILDATGTIICSNAKCLNVTFGSSGNGCQNTFTYTNQNLTFTFAGSINSSNPTTYNWHFGDGTSGSGQYVTHTYAQPPSGSNGYNVCLITSTMNAGAVCSDTSCMLVTINNTSGSIIQGHVYAGNYPVSNGYVLLYQANNATMSYALIDTLALDSSGYYHYNFLAVPPVNPAFLLKAVLNSNASNFNLFAPTFYLHTINWFSATPVFPSANTINYNINMIPLANPISGNGSMSGNVILLGTKGNTPLSGIELILTDDIDNPMKINYSDANGNFNFNNLTMGNYKLHVEIAGINYTPYPFSLNNTNPSINNITVNVNNNGAVITGIENESKNSFSISEIYPNPATSEAFIEFKNATSDKVTITIFNNTGMRLVSEEFNVSDNQRININQKQLPVGVYTVKISSSNGINSFRKLIISK